jgi:hypothetical protein
MEFSLVIAMAMLSGMMEGTSTDDTSNPKTDFVHI